MFPGKFKKSLFDTDNTAQQLEGCAAYLVKLYKNHEPAYYPLPATGILRPEQLMQARLEIVLKLTSCDTDLIAVRDQCLVLLSRLNMCAKALGLPDQDIMLQVYRDRFIYPDSLGDNAAYHLSSTKRALEHVCYLLDSDKIPAQRQTKVVLELCARLAACASGAQTEITYALRMLKGHTGIIASFQALMETAFKLQYIPKHPRWIYKLSTDPGNEIHVINGYALKCCGPDFLPHIVIQDPDAPFFAKKITDEEAKIVRQHFWKYMTPEKVINDLVENVFQQLTLTFQELSQLPDFQDENLSQWLAGFLGISADLIPEFTYTVASIKPNRIDPSIRDWLKSHIKEIILEPSDTPEVIAEPQFFSVEKACRLTEAAKEITSVAYKTGTPLTDEPLLPIDEYLEWAKKIAPHFDTYTDQLIDIYLRAYTYFDANCVPRIDIDKIVAQFASHLLYFNLGEKQLLIRLSQIHSLIQHDPDSLRQDWMQTPVPSDDYINYFSWVTALNEVCDSPTWKTLTSAFSSISSEPGFDNSFLLSITLFKSINPAIILKKTTQLYAQNPDQFITKALVLHHYHKQTDTMPRVLKVMTNCLHDDPDYYEHHKPFVWSLFMLGFQLMKTRALDALCLHQQETELRIPLLESAIWFAAENRAFSYAAIQVINRSLRPIEVEEIVRCGNKSFTFLALADMTATQFEASLQRYLEKYKTLSQRCIWLYTRASVSFKQKIEYAHYTYCLESMAQENPDAGVVANILKDLAWVLGLFSSNRSGQDEKKALFNFYAAIPSLQKSRALWEFALTIPGLLFEQYGDKPFTDFAPSDMHAAMLKDPSCHQWIADQFSQLDKKTRDKLLQDWKDSDWKDNIFQWYQTEIGFAAFMKWLEELSPETLSTSDTGVDIDFGSILAEVIYMYHDVLPYHLLLSALQKNWGSALPSALVEKDQLFSNAFNCLIKEVRKMNYTVSCCKLASQLIYGNPHHWEKPSTYLALFESGHTPSDSIMEMFKYMEVRGGNDEIADKILSIPAYRTLSYLQPVLRKHPQMRPHIKTKRISMIVFDSMTRDDLVWIKASIDKDLDNIFPQYWATPKHEILAFVQSLDNSVATRYFFPAFASLAISLLNENQLETPFNFIELLDNLEHSASTLLKFLCWLAQSPDSATNILFFMEILKLRYKLDTANQFDFFIEFPVRAENVLDLITYCLPHWHNERERCRVLNHWRDKKLIPDTEALCQQIKKQAEHEEMFREERLLLADQIELWFSPKPLPLGLLCDFPKSWWDNFNDYCPYFFTEKDEHKIFRRIFNTLSLIDPIRVMNKYTYYLEDHPSPDVLVPFNILYAIDNTISVIELRKTEGMTDYIWQILQNQEHRREWAAQPVLRDALLGELLTPYTGCINQVRYNCFGRSKTRAFLKMTNKILSFKSDDLVYPALKAAFGRFLQFRGRIPFGRLDGKHRRALISAFGIDEKYAKEARLEYLHHKIHTLKNNGRFFSALYRAFKYLFHYEKQYKALKKDGIVLHRNPLDDATPFKNYNHWENTYTALIPW